MSATFGGLIESGNVKDRVQFNRAGRSSKTKRVHITYSCAYEFITSQCQYLFRHVKGKGEGMGNGKSWCHCCKETIYNGIDRVIGARKEKEKKGGGKKEIIR
ncbi:hypothetical protein TESG_08242 [Trichophyton tonsurans CBS 112818]|uniref:Uncharacterized protein n=1 Tax=Trichophyton tonsurans (strain CBS 112818) TaxID=647933 RepID=F2RN25_TRIT1|nr:hypothetical protein TESG_08242 [Trichophyton tonsurans CBS 112818]